MPPAEPPFGSDGRSDRQGSDRRIFRRLGWRPPDRVWRRRRAVRRGRRFWTPRWHETPDPTNPFDTGRRRLPRAIACGVVPLLAAMAVGPLAPSPASVRAARAVTRTGPYVALGDSYASGPLIPEQTGSPVWCLRSTHSYPFDVAAALKPHGFVDVTCTGARTADMTQPQHIANGDVVPPQLSVLRRNDSLVTLTIGGDDIDFTGLVEKCGKLSMTDPLGAPCTAYYTAGGVDRLAEAVAAAGPKVAAVLRDIRARAPRAKVLVVGYSDLLPNSGDGCWPIVPFAYGDVPYLRMVEKDLNRMLAAEAAAAGDVFVNTYSGSIGHDACKGPRTQWVEGLVPDTLATPLHPNRTGERQMADRVIAALRRTR